MSCYSDKRYWFTEIKGSKMVKQTFCDAGSESEFNFPVQSNNKGNLVSADKSVLTVKKSKIDLKTFYENQQIRGFKMKNILLATVLITLSTTGYSASFDCVKAKSPIEKAICSDSELGSLDEQLGNIYTSLRNNLSGSAKAKLRLHQTTWIKSLSTDCSIEIKGKDIKKLATCLNASYKLRVALLETYTKPISGMYKYPSLGKTTNVSVEFFDGSTPNVIFVNNIIEKSMETDDYAGNFTLDIEISPLAGSAVKVARHIATEDGSHPDFDINWYYIDVSKPISLKLEDFFKKTKLQELSVAILNKLKTDADADTLDCYSSIDANTILELFTADLSNVDITANGITLLLGVPRYCRSQDFAEIDINTLKPYISDRYQSFAK